MGGAGRRRARAARWPRSPSCSSRGPCWAGLPRSSPSGSAASSRPTCGARLLARAVALGPRWAAEPARAARSSCSRRAASTRSTATSARYLPQVALAAIVPVAVVVVPARGGRRRGADGGADGAADPGVHGPRRADVGGAPARGAGRRWRGSPTASSTSSPACRRCAPTAGPTPRWRSCAGSPTPTASRRWGRCGWPSSRRWSWSCWRRSRWRWWPWASGSGWPSAG